MTKCQDSSDNITNPGHCYEVWHGVLYGGTNNNNNNRDLKRLDSQSPKNCTSQFSQTSSIIWRGGERRTLPNYI